MATSLTAGLNAGASLVPAKMYDFERYFGAEQYTTGWTGTGTGGTPGTTSFAFVGDRPAVSMVAGASGRGYNFTQNNVNYRTVAGKSLTFSMDFRLTAYTEAHFAFGFAVDAAGALPTNLYTAWFDTSITLTDYAAVYKVAAATKPAVHIKEASGSLQTVTFGDDDGVNDTWYDCYITLTQDATTVKKGTVTYGIKSAGAAGDAITSATTQIAASNFPSGVSLVPFIAFYDPTAASTAYFNRVSISMDR